MMPELGNLALTLACAVALVQSALGLMALHARTAPLSTLVRPAAVVFALLVSLAFAALLSAYIDSDFSVINVVENSHSAKPLLYKFTGAWGNHEGSLLLWVCVLGAFGFFIATSARFDADPPLRAVTLGVQGLIATGFCAFILLTSNPFLRVFPPAVDGNDLNPLLQDIGLALHPPMLYLGYVGYSIVFALAVAALLLGRVDRRWASLSKPWILLTWSTLTLGIGLGSWWAYRELGWGGWWFWDPVENASLLPWLAGTALLHSNLVLERRGQMAHWVLLLGIITFSLSLVGTFLVRSGLITSVHSFASDPTRGLFILAYMAVITGGALLIYALRAGNISAAEPAHPLSRQGGIALNNVFLMTACATVFLGTIYPLLAEFFFAKQVSVGPPFFNATFLPLMVPIMLLMAIAPLVPWNRWRSTTLRHYAPGFAVAGLAAAWITLYVTETQRALSVAGMVLAAWLLVGTWLGVVRAAGWPEQGWRAGLLRLRRQSPSFWGMVLAHSGVAMLLAGVVASSLWRVSMETHFTPNTPHALGPFTLALERVEPIEGPNYTATQGQFSLAFNGAPVATLTPEYRHYPVRNEHTSEAAIRSRFTYDAYTVAGAWSESKGLAAKAFYIPLMNWIWLGFVAMAAGGMLSFILRQKPFAPNIAMSANMLAEMPHTSSPPSQ